VGKRLSAEDNRLRMDLYLSGLTDAAIGRSLNRVKCTIHEWRRVRGLQRNIHVRPRQQSQSRVFRPLRDDLSLRKRAFGAYVAGASIAGVARALGLNRNTLRRELRREGLSRSYFSLPSRPTPCGEVVAAYVMGQSLNGTARSFGVSVHALRRILVRDGLLRACVQPAKNEMLRHPAVVAMLGQIADAAVARVVVCSRNTVWKYRRSLGIKAHRPITLPSIRIFSIDKPRWWGGSYHDVYEDRSWSPWLEEMGATIW